MGGRATRPLRRASILSQESHGTMPPPPPAGSSWWGAFDFPKIKGRGDRKRGSLCSTRPSLGREPGDGWVYFQRWPPRSVDYFWSTHRPHFSFRVAPVLARDAWPFPGCLPAMRWEPPNGVWLGWASPHTLSWATFWAGWACLGTRRFCRTGLLSVWQREATSFFHLLAGAPWGLSPSHRTPPHLSSLPDRRGNNLP